MPSICWVWKMFVLHENKWVLWKGQQWGRVASHCIIPWYRRSSIFSSHLTPIPGSIPYGLRLLGFLRLVVNLKYVLWYSFVCTGNSHYWLAKLFELNSFPSFQSVNFHQFSSSCSISTEDRSASTTLYNQISTWGFLFLFLPGNSILYEGFF